MKSPGAEFFYRAAIGHSLPQPCIINPHSPGEEQSNTSRHLNMMLAAGVRSRRKDGLQIHHTIKHPEILEIVDIAKAVVKLEIHGRHSLFEAV